MAEKKQEKKKDGAQASRVRPQGWLEARQISRTIRRLTHVLRYNGENAARSYAVNHMVDGALNKMLRSPEYQRFVRARSRRALTYPERRAQKRAAKREAERLERLAEQAAQQAAVAEPLAEVLQSALVQEGATSEVPEKPVSRVRRRTAAAKLKPKAKPRAKAKAPAKSKRRVITVRGRVRPDPEKATKPRRKG